jgi:hypothetical protein
MTESSNRRNVQNGHPRRSRVIASGIGILPMGSAKHRLEADATSDLLEFASFGPLILFRNSKFEIRDSKF